MLQINDTLAAFFLVHSRDEMQMHIQSLRHCCCGDCFVFLHTIKHLMLLSAIETKRNGKQNQIIKKKA